MFLNYFLKLNTFNITIVLFPLIIGNILAIYYIPKIFQKVKVFLKINKKSKFLEDLAKVSKQQEIFRRKLFSLKIEKYLFLSRFFFNKLSKKVIIFVYFLPHLLFLIFFLIDIFFQDSLLFSVAIFSFTFLFCKIFLRIILFSGFWSNLFGLFDIIHPCYFTTILEKSPYENFYNEVLDLFEGFFKGLPIYQLLYKDIYLEISSELQSYREQCYLYKLFFIPALQNFHLVNKLQFFRKPCLWLYFFWSLQALGYVTMENFFLSDSNFFLNSLNQEVFFIYLKIFFILSLVSTLIFWIFYYFNFLYELFFEKNVYINILEEYHIPALEEFFQKKYNFPDFYNFYKNYKIDSDNITEKEQLFQKLRSFWLFIKTVFYSGGCCSILFLSYFLGRLIFIK